MRVVLPIRRAANTDRLIPRREVMDALAIQSHERVKRLVERGELPEPVSIGNAKAFRLSQLQEKFPGIFGEPTHG